MAALRWQTTTRYYQVKVQRDLFGGLAILCSWGGLRSRRAQQKLIPCADLAMLRKLVRRIGKQRRRHGYVFMARPGPLLPVTVVSRVTAPRKTAPASETLPLFGD